MVSMGLNNLNLLVSSLTQKTKRNDIISHLCGEQISRSIGIKIKASYYECKAGGPIALYYIPVYGYFMQRTHI